MVKRSKKSKSKRVSLKKKYKVIRKVKEHNRKKTKEAKKLRLSGKKKVEKDPGIPNDWPFKEQELKALEARRAKAIEELEKKKAERKERARKRKLGLLEDEDNSNLSEKDSLKESKDFATVGNTRDGSDRAFYKDLVKVIEASDVLLEVLDARDPLGTRCVDIEKMVMKLGPDKRLVLLLNKIGSLLIAFFLASFLLLGISLFALANDLALKIDLVPQESVEKWLKYLREELPTVAFKCSTQQQRSNLGWKPSKKAKTSDILQLSDCLGADTLLKLLKNYSRSHEIKKSITVGLIGLPNVGKSSVINSLKRCHVVNVGSTPGLTRSMQEVQLDKNVKLLDCPGVVMLKSQENDASVALKNCKRIEKLADPIGPVKEILKLCPDKQLVSLYNILSFKSGDADDFLRLVATVRGKLKKGGIVDIDAAARIVLHDWNEGKIRYYTTPPNRDQGESSEAKIVSEFLQEFNIDEVYNNESSYIGSLKSADDFNAVEVPSSRPLNLDETMLEDETQIKPSEQGEGSGNMAEVDESMEEDNDVGKNKGNSAASRQNEKLYAADDMLNTKMRGAEKKKRKKAYKALSPLDPMDGDYDFKVDYFQNGATMDAEESKSEDDDEQDNNFEVPMSGIQVDE